MRPVGTGRSFPTMTSTSRVERRVAMSHGMFWVGSGLWPIVDLKSFERVTGPKTDGWLVKTVGGLIAVVGVTLVAAGARHRITPEIRGLAMGSSLALAAVDVVYPLKRRISPLYLLDAVAELAFAATWLKRRPSRGLLARFRH